MGALQAAEMPIRGAIAIMRDEELIDRRAEEGTRVVALGLLSDADQAARALERQDDEEALHDFRVALRRLRSALRIPPLVGGGRSPEASAATEATGPTHQRRARRRGSARVAVHRARNPRRGAMPGRLRALDEPPRRAP